jgi:protoheme IX farnesyltransferase
VSLSNTTPGALPQATALRAPSAGPTRSVGAWVDFVALTKPRVTLLVIFPAMVGLHLAPGAVCLWQALSALLGSVLLVASANTLNCVLERDSDGFMTRTRNRPLPAGRMNAGPATAFGLLLLCGALPLLLGAGWLTAALGLFAHVVYVLAYTPLKRVSAWSTYVGFVPGAMPALMGWTAVTNHVDLGGVLLFLVVFIWQIPHTLAIGLFRGPEYAAAGIHVVPNAVGPRAAAWQMVLTSALLIPVGLGFHLAGLTGAVSAVVSVACAVAFMAFSVRGLTAIPGSMQWARRVFFFSMAYLTLVLLVLTVDKV